MANRSSWLIALSLVIATFTVEAQADSAAFRAAQSANANLLYQWSFEGDATQRLLDTSGSADVRNLQPVIGINGGNPANINYVPGFDASSTAMEPERIDEGESGSALGSLDDPMDPEDDLFLPQLMTVEVLFKVDSTTLSCSGSVPECIAYGPNTRQWPQRRGYYLVQDSQAGSITNGDIAIIIGGSFNNNRRTVIDSSDLVADDWYYYAVTLEASEPEIDVIEDSVFPQDSDGSDTFLNAYWANLSAGDTTLTQAINDETITGGWSGPKNSVSPSDIGIGTFSENVKQSWDGALDEVAFYDEVLTQSQLQSNLDALLAAVGTPGDFDSDGDVDGNDFLQWQTTDATPGGLSEWQSNYPNALSAISTVPEPSSFLITQTVLVLLAGRRRFSSPPATARVLNCR